MNTKTLEIKLRPLHAIKPLPGNAKLHDLDDIKASIRAFGFIDPIGVNPETDHDIDGNGRLQALKQMYAEGGSAPSRIVVKMEAPEDGSKKKVPVWYVPTVDLPFDRETEALVALRLNRSNEKGGYDKKAVFDILQQAAAFDRLEETGYARADLESLAEKFAPPPPFTPPPWHDEEDQPSGGRQAPRQSSTSTGERPETPAPPPVPPPSHVRMLQLFLTTETHPVLVDRCARLIRSGQYKNDDGTPAETVTDLIYAVIRDAELALEESNSR